MKNRACENCLFWNWRAGRPELGVESVGECRHQPPLTTTPKWPITHASDWCGEFLPKANKA